MRWSPPAPKVEGLKLHFSGACKVNGEQVLEPKAGLPIPLDCGSQGLVGSVSFEAPTPSFGRIGVNIEWLDGSQSFLLTTGNPPSVDFGSKRSLSSLQVLGEYVALGVEHIWMGMDHMLFLLGLLLLVRSWKSLVATITAFTLAHSVTLAAATLGLLKVRTAPVEICIALSVLLLAIEATRDEQTATRRWPWLVAFSFGLLHGLGFASALSEVGLPKDAVAVSLVGFNLGVELGQVTVVALVFGAYRLLKSRPRFLFNVESVAVWGLGVCSVFWLLQRVELWLLGLGVLG